MDILGGVFQRDPALQANASAGSGKRCGVLWSLPWKSNISNQDPRFSPGALSTLLPGTHIVYRTTLLSLPKARHLASPMHLPIPGTNVAEWARGKGRLEAAWIRRITSIRRPGGGRSRIKTNTTNDRLHTRQTTDRTGLKRVGGRPAKRISLSVCLLSLSRRLLLWLSHCGIVPLDCSVSQCQLHNSITPPAWRVSQVLDESDPAFRPLKQPNGEGSRKGQD